jgi:hypothetical protein
MEQQSLESIGPLLHWLEDTPLAQSIAESNWIFPIIETIHVIALALLLGTVCVVDLRLLGWASAQRPYRQIAREVLPWTWAAFGISVMSGGLMFITKAPEYYANTAFRIKALCLLLAGINMLVFELATARDAAKWIGGLPAPWPGRLGAAFSLLLWIAVVFFGRRVGFTMTPG